MKCLNASEYKHVTGKMANKENKKNSKSTNKSSFVTSPTFTFPWLCLQTWEEKKHIFSAVTSGIRANWVQALRNAANLKEQKDRPLTLGEKIEREIVAKKEKTNTQGWLWHFHVLFHFI